MTRPARRFAQPLALTAAMVLAAGCDTVSGDAAQDEDQDDPELEAAEAEDDGEESVAEAEQSDAEVEEPEKAEEPEEVEEPEEAGTEDDEQASGETDDDARDDEAPADVDVGFADSHPGGVLLEVGETRFGETVIEVDIDATNTGGATSP